MPTRNLGHLWKSLTYGTVNDKYGVFLILKHKRRFFFERFSISCVAKIVLKEHIFATFNCFLLLHKKPTSKKLSSLHPFERNTDELVGFSNHFGGKISFAKKVVLRIRGRTFRWENTFLVEDQGKIIFLRGKISHHGTTPHVPKRCPAPLGDLEEFLPSDFGNTSALRSASRPLAKVD